MCQRFPVGGFLNMIVIAADVQATLLESEVKDEWNSRQTVDYSQL